MSEGRALAIALHRWSSLHMRWAESCAESVEGTPGWPRCRMTAAGTEGEMSHVQKANRTYAAEIEGKTAVVFVGDQGAEIGFPTVGLSAVFENAKRLAMAYDAQHNRVSEEWKFVLYAHPSTHFS